MSNNWVLLTVLVTLLVALAALLRVLDLEADVERLAALVRHFHLR